MSADPELLRAIPLLAGLGPLDRAAIASLMTPARLVAGEATPCEGDLGCGICVISRGKVELLLPAEDETTVVVEILGVGDFFGELDGGATLMTARALDDTDLLRIGRGEFLTLLRRHPDMSVLLVEMLARRLRQREKQLRRCRRRWVASPQLQLTIAHRDANWLSWLKATRVGSSWNSAGLLMSYVVVNGLMLSRILDGRRSDLSPFILLNVLLALLALLHA